MGRFVFRRVQEGYNGEPAITENESILAKSTRQIASHNALSLSYLNWSEEVSAALVARLTERMNEWMNEQMFETLGCL